ATLFTETNIQSLAKIISSEEDSFNILVPMHVEGKKHQIFAAPGVGGNVLSFQPLSSALGKDQPFYGLQAIGLDGRSEPLGSVEAIAESNISALRAVQKPGPYSLIGHSFGGVVAYEMARKLLQQGDKIKSLVLLDSIPPSTLKDALEYDESSLLLNACLGIAEQQGIDLRPEQFRKFPKTNQKEFVSSVFADHGLEIDIEQLSVFFKVFQANQRSYNTYWQKPLSQELDVLLIRAAKERQNINDLPQDFGWDKYLISPARVHDVEATHFSMLESDNIHLVTQIISS
ncbi:MAG: alpha/beta fold hydrolase, partial [Kangiellaceae bacterium]|nr:alpha/beta fold hydrolase [Kangiellaceae bacterium]